MGKTIRDVAEMANVSPATVSRYFSGSKIVSTELARKIEAIAKQIGYVHKRKVQRDRGIIAVLIPHLKFGFFAK